MKIISLVLFHFWVDGSWLLRHPESQKIVIHRMFTSLWSNKWWHLITEFLGTFCAVCFHKKKKNMFIFRFQDLYLQKNLCLIGSNINFMSIQGKTTNITHEIWLKTTLEFLIETVNRPPEPWTTQKFQLNPSYTDFLNVVQTK